MRQRILVVEDNPVNRELLCDWLEIEGFEVLSAETLAESFAILKGEPPAVILLDVQLGAEDGLSLAKWIRQHPTLNSIPIIAVTAHAMVSDHERVIEAGCNSCVSKPVDLKLLGKQIEQYLQNSTVPSH